MHPCGDIQTYSGKGTLSPLSWQQGWELCLSHHSPSGTLLRWAAAPVTASPDQE